MIDEARTANRPELSERAALPIYLSSRFDGKYPLVRASLICPFCSGAKSEELLSCFSCYSSYLLRDDGGGGATFILDARERALEEELRSAPTLDVDEEFADKGRQRRKRAFTILFAMLAVCCVVVWAAIMFYPPPGSSPRASRAWPGQVIEPGDIGGSELVAPALITDEDRRTASLLFVKTVYDVDSETREADLLAALQMVDERNREAFKGVLLDRTRLRREARDGLRSWFERTSLEIDPLDEWLVRIEGIRHIELKSGATESKRLSLKIRLAVDRAGRTPANQMTGLLIAECDSLERKLE